MDIKLPFKEKDLYRMVNVALLSCIVIVTFGSLFGIAEAKGFHIAIAVLIVLVISFFRHLFFKRRIVSVLGLIAFFGMVVVAAGIDRVVLFFESYINWLGDKGQWQQEWVSGYESMQIFWMVLLCCLFHFLQEKDFRIKGATAIVLLGVLVYCMAVKLDIAYGGVVCSICYLVLVLTEWTQRNWNKVKRRSFSGYMLWILPFLVIYFALLIQMPVSSKPYDWQIFKNAYKKLEENFLILSQNLFKGDSEYDLGLSSFSEESELGEGLLNSEKKVMTIKSDKGLKTNVYLTGKVFDTFDGKSWQAFLQEPDRARYMDTVETLYAARRYDNEYLSDYLQYTDLSIRYQYLRSDYVFAPMKAWSIYKEGKEVDFTARDGSLFFEKKQNYGSEFEADFYQLNGNPEVLYDFLEAEKEENPELLKKILFDLQVRASVTISPEELQEYREFCYENYMQEIALSKETAAYLEQITQNAKTDVEKLKAIEEELSSFTYTLHPGEMPDSVIDGSTFLDYFLLDSRQGYCTYFATAFTLLARAEGIPARYVQGYCVPIRGSEEVVVTSSMAHAWPEVYLDDVGWIPFEPTPGYGKMRYTSWNTKKQSDAAASYGKNFAGENTVGKDAEDDTVLESDEVSENVDTVSEAATLRRLEKVMQIVGMTVAFAFFSVLLTIVLERLLSRYHYQKMDEKQKYAAEIMRNLKILSKLGMKIDNRETLAEFKMRIESELPEEVSLRFIEDYEKVLYGNRCVDEEMMRTALDEQEQLMGVFKERKRWGYVWYRVWGR